MDAQTPQVDLLRHGQEVGDKLLTNLRVTSPPVLNRLRGVTENQIGTVVQENALTNLVFYAPDDHGGYDKVIKLFNPNAPLVHNLPREAWALSFLQKHGFDVTGSEQISIPLLHSVDLLNSALIMSPVASNLSKFDSGTFLQLMADGIAKFASLKDETNEVPRSPFTSLDQFVGLIHERLSYFTEWKAKLEDGIGSNPTEVEDYEKLLEEINRLGIVEKVNARFDQLREVFTEQDMHKPLSSKDEIITPGDFSNLNAIFKTTTTGDPGVCFLDPELLHIDNWQFVLAMYVQNPGNFPFYSSEEKRVELMKGLLNDVGFKLGADSESIKMLNTMVMIADMAWLASYLKSFPMGYKDVLAHDDRFRNRAHFLLEELVPAVSHVLTIDPKKMLLPEVSPTKTVLQADANLEPAEYFTKFGTRPPVTQYEIWAANLVKTKNLNPIQEAETTKNLDLAFPFTIPEMLNNPPFVIGGFHDVQQIATGYYMVTADVYSMLSDRPEPYAYRFLAETAEHHQKNDNFLFIVGDSPDLLPEQTTLADRTLSVSTNALESLAKQASRAGVKDMRHIREFVDKLKSLTEIVDADQTVTDFKVYDNPGFFSVIVATFVSGESVPLVVNYLGVDNSTASVYSVKNPNGTYRLTIKSRMLPPSEGGRNMQIETCRAFADAQVPFAEIAFDYGIGRHEFDVNGHVDIPQEVGSNATTIRIHDIRLKPSARLQRWNGSDSPVAAKPIEEVRIRDLRMQDIFTGVKTGKIQDNFTLAAAFLYGDYKLTNEARGKYVYLQKSTVLSQGKDFSQMPRTQIGVGQIMEKMLTNTGAGDTRKVVDVSEITPEDYLANSDQSHRLRAYPIAQLREMGKRGELDAPTLAALFVGFVTKGYIN